MSQTQIKPTKKLSAKDIAELLEIGQRSAEQIYTDIKKHFGIRAVLYGHFKTYFSI